MSWSFGRTAALLVAGASVLAACASPSASRDSGSGAVGRQAQGVSGQAPSVVEDQAPAAVDGQQQNPTEASVPVGLVVGQRAPAFVVTGLDGRQISDADLRAQGKPYILYFYATW